jgi:predicted Zn-dependent peptidase
MRRDEAAAYAGREYVPGAAYLIAVGDVDPDSLECLTGESFGGWVARPAPPDPTLPTPGGSPGSVFLLDRPGSAQSEIRMGRPALSRRDDEVFPAIVLNRVLGGQFTSRLNTVLREQKGLTYGVRSFFSFTRRPGPFSIATSVDTARTAEALETLEIELRRVSTAGITAEEVVAAQRGICGGFALALEQHSQVAAMLDTIVLHGLPGDYYDRYLARIRAVSEDDTAACAARWLNPETMTTVVVGDAGVFRGTASPSLRARLRSWTDGVSGHS